MHSGPPSPPLEGESPGPPFPPTAAPVPFAPPYSGPIPWGSPPPDFLQQKPCPQPLPLMPVPPATVAGDNSNVVSGLCYLTWLVALIIFFTTQRNPYVKFHAAQALIIHLVAIISNFVWILVFLAIIVTGVAASVGTSSSGFVSSLAGVTVFMISFLGMGLFFCYLAALIWGMIAAFTGKATKLPLVGEVAERWAGGLRPPPGR
jgi:uncharacterized membrane protein